MTERVAIILAAGISKRMHTELPKVLHEVCGRPMLAYVLDACREVGIEKIYVVVGFGNEQIKERFNKAVDIVWIQQKEQRGTAHAVSCCRQYLKDFQGQTLVLCGDGPLIRASTLKTLIKKHDEGQPAATLATAILDEPAGYGRIIRDENGNIKAIVEHTDCTQSQLEINEVNPSYYLFNNQILFDAVQNIKPDNVKNEFYLTDAVAHIIETDHKVLAVTAVRTDEARGVNSRAQLTEANKIMQRRIQQKLMDNGVTIVDPDNTWIDIKAQIGQDTVIEPFTYIHGDVKIGKACRIGPFAYLRHGTVLGDDVILGVFAEVKNSTLADGVRARHNLYIGDAAVGHNVNLGAGSITANFDGENVNRTNIGDDCYIGSGVVLIAPLELKSGTHIGAGKTVSQKSIDKSEKND
ncbi:MAG: NTP transferase domain-containing protein [Phycisphaerae bacterium]|nr:NTP transferase domain-containing protein [Phycisphaerae bacterium]NIW70720.1 NTP transferase domain-containing protein [candidate division KSB1 bacterium]NIP51255.1 NTP transferase domain-containing protein [Phycisphaerae bacterium]NIS50458.1 NTP transferase domain-containing protein [Phycisphaerae bacterium]NIU08198.1 NTP transferase domain-containing protein [Phycisphaerae bacterium]